MKECLINNWGEKKTLPVTKMEIKKPSEIFLFSLPLDDLKIRNVSPSIHGSGESVPSCTNALPLTNLGRLT